MTKDGSVGKEPEMVFRENVNFVLGILVIKLIFGNFPYAVVGFAGCGGVTIFLTIAATLVITKTAMAIAIIINKTLSMVLVSFSRFT